MKATEQEFQEALKTHAHATILHADYVVAASKGDRAIMRMCHEAIQRLVPSGLYEHFKSKEGDTKFYIVADVDIEVDTCYPSVSYKSLYGDLAGLPANRPLLFEKESVKDTHRAFVMPINRPEYRGPRFRLVEKLSPKEIAVLLDYVGELSGIKRTDKFLQRAGKAIKRPLV